MSIQNVTPMVGIAAYPDRQEPVPGPLFQVPGVHHPDCIKAATVHQQRRNRLGFNRWGYLMLMHSACDGCAHHPRNEYGTWIADALGFEWRAWAGYLYGPVVVAATIGTRRAAHGFQPAPELYEAVAPPMADARLQWDNEQAALPLRHRAEYRLAQWHEHQEWRLRERWMARRAARHEGP